MLRNPSELFLAAALLIFAIPYFIWKVFKTESYAPIFIVQIICGILLGPAILGEAFPDFYSYIFNPENFQAISGVAWLGVIFFVWTAGVHLNFREAIAQKKDTFVTSAFGLLVPLIFGTIFAYFLHSQEGLMGGLAQTWQFSFGIGMAISVTSLPVLVALMQRLGIFKTAIGDRALRYASLDDIAIWMVLSIIIMDWDRSLRQFIFIPIFILLALIVNKVFPKFNSRAEVWAASLIWVIFISLAADWSGLHYTVGAFLAGAVMKQEWFGEKQLDSFQGTVLLLMMPFFFLVTGLKTDWSLSGYSIILLTLALFVLQFSSKGAGMFLAGKTLGWKNGDWKIFATLLQTKGLVEIIFCTILLEKDIITAQMFTALLIMAVASTIVTTPISKRLISKIT